MDAKIVVLEAQPTVAVRVQQPIDQLDIGALFGRHLPLLFARLGELRTAPTGAPYGRYFEWGPVQVDMEIGVPVPSRIAELAPLAGCASGEIGRSELPSGRAATSVHAGPYDGISATMLRLHAWILEQGEAPGHGQWESYVSDPALLSDPSDLRTDLFWPLER